MIRLDPRLRPWAAAAATFALGLLAAHGRHTPYDNFVLQARAWLAGREAIDWPGPYIDALRYRGAYYVIEAPLPALLALPFVFLTGGANQTTLALALAAAAIGFTWTFNARVGVAAGTNAWICAGLLAGTDLLWCAMLGDVWFIAHVAAVAATAAALAELAGPRRGWAVGLAGVAAVFSRFALVLALPVYAWLLARERDPRERRRALLAFGLCVGVGALLWVAHNEARWGLPYDIGYTAWYHQDPAGAPTGSPFRLAYVPYELWSFFLQGPAFSPAAPYVAPTLSGVALTWTSPWLAFALLARRPRPLVAAFALAALLLFAVNATYYVNGFAQFGMRHALDFAPFLAALVALAAAQRRGLPWWGRAAIAWSCFAGVWGIWYWDAVVRPAS